MKKVSYIFVIFIILGYFFAPAYITEWIFWKLSSDIKDKPDKFLNYTFVIFVVSLILFLIIES